MAIRFRCAFCNQLMGIAQRKVGSVVRCPKCSGQVVVPATSDTESTPGTAKPTPPLPRSGVFDLDDFGKIFQQQAPSGDAPSIIDVEPVRRRRGVFVSVWFILLGVIFFLILLGAAFLSGWHVGTQAEFPWR